MRNGMSIEMYNFILDNKDKIKYDLDSGLIFTPKNTNGTLCSSTGYLKVKINKKILQVHQILSVIYFGDVNVGMTVNHKDGNKLNNNKYNLEVISISDNIKHAFENGLYDSIKKKVGRFDLDGNLLETFESLNSCKKYGYDVNSIYRCIRGFKMRKGVKLNIKTYKKFKWKYI